MSASHEENVMSIYPILSALLTYPEQPLLDALPEIERALDAQPGARAALAPEARGTPVLVRGTFGPDAGAIGAATLPMFFNFSPRAGLLSGAGGAWQAGRVGSV